MDKHLVSSLDALSQRQKIRVQINNRAILVAYVNGSVYAIQDKCPHLGASLYTGTISGDIITCKEHKLAISLKDGLITDREKAKFLRMDADSTGVRTFVTSVENGNVYVFV